MALTNFSLLTNEQKTAWSLDLWKQARNMSFLNQFAAAGHNSMITRVSELKKSEKGTRAVVTLLADLEGDGVAGDRTLEGNEEAMKTYEQVIRIDQLRHANRHEGRMADQKSVVEFRENSKNVLAYWLSDRIDQMGFLTLSGTAYSVKNSGGTRVGSDLVNLEFAADVAAPTAKRYGRWNGTTKLIEWGTGNASIAAADTPMWEMFVQAKAYAKDHYIRPVGGNGGEEMWHVFLSPAANALLKMDTNYMANLRYAQPRSDSNPLFTGASVKIDGMMFHEFRHVVNTRTAAGGSKWGGGAVDGCQILMCGAQSLAWADIGAPYWNEKGFDYENSQGISTGKIFGMLKPKFYSQYDSSTEDFGVISLYVKQ